LHYHLKLDITYHQDHLNQKSHLLNPKRLYHIPKESSFSDRQIGTDHAFDTHPRIKILGSSSYLDPDKKQFLKITRRGSTFFPQRTDQHPDDTLDDFGETSRSAVSDPEKMVEVESRKSTPYSSFQLIPPTISGELVSDHDDSWFEWENKNSLYHTMVSGFASVDPDQPEIYLMPIRGRTTYEEFLAPKTLKAPQISPYSVTVLAPDILGLIRKFESKANSFPAGYYLTPVAADVPPPEDRPVTALGITPIEIGGVDPQKPTPMLSGSEPIPNISDKIGIPRIIFDDSDYTFENGQTSHTRGSTASTSHMAPQDVKPARLPVLKPEPVLDPQYKESIKQLESSLSKPRIGGAGYYLDSFAANDAPLIQSEASYESLKSSVLGMTPIDTGEGGPKTPTPTPTVSESIPSVSDWKIGSKLRPIIVDSDYTFENYGLYSHIITQRGGTASRDFLSFQDYKPAVSDERKSTLDAEILKLIELFGSSANSDPVPMPMPVPMPISVPMPMPQIEGDGYYLIPVAAKNAHASSVEARLYDVQQVDVVRPTPTKSEPIPIYNDTLSREAKYITSSDSDFSFDNGFWTRGRVTSSVHFAPQDIKTGKPSVLGHSEPVSDAQTQEMIKQLELSLKKPQNQPIVIQPEQLLYA